MKLNLEIHFLTKLVGKVNELLHLYFLHASYLCYELLSNLAVHFFNLVCFVNKV